LISHRLRFVLVKFQKKNEKTREKKRKKERKKRDFFLLEIAKSCKNAMKNVFCFQRSFFFVLSSALVCCGQISKRKAKIKI